MLLAADIAVARGTMPEEDRSAIAGLITQMGPLPAITDLSISQIIEAIGRDKKVVAGTLHFVLPRSIGTCEVVSDVTEEEIMRALGNLGLTVA